MNREGNLLFPIFVKFDELRVLLVGGGAVALEKLQALEKSNPGRPWRILHLNRAIVATRTHQPDVMDEAFTLLTECLPEDAPGFFSQGMEQMDLLNYPPHVREVMNRYYRKWSVNRSLH